MRLQIVPVFRTLGAGHRCQAIHFDLIRILNHLYPGGPTVGGFQTPLMVFLSLNSINQDRTEQAEHEDLAAEHNPFCPRRFHENPPGIWQSSGTIHDTLSLTLPFKERIQTTTLLVNKAGQP